MNRQRKRGIPRANLGRAQYSFSKGPQTLHRAPPNQSSQHTWTSLRPIKAPGESTCESTTSSPKNLMLKITCQTQSWVISSSHSLRFKCPTNLTIRRQLIARNSVGCLQKTERSNRNLADGNPLTRISKPSKVRTTLCTSVRATFLPIWGQSISQTTRTPYNSQKTAPIQKSHTSRLTNSQRSLNL